MIFGRGGQLGRELFRVFESAGHQVSGFERSQVDVTNATRVEHAVATAAPDLVLNATAYNMVDVAEREPEAAFAGNALAVRSLALACRQADARLVHFSTDYVFDGTLGRPYTEEDATHPLGAYGVSKLAGEFYARAYLDNPLIIRTSGVFGLGGLQTARGNFVETMLRLAASGQPVRVVEDFVASPPTRPNSRCEQPNSSKKLRESFISAAAPHLVVRLRQIDLRGSSIESRVEGDHRAGTSHACAPSQVLRAFEREDGAMRDNPDALDANCSRGLHAAAKTNCRGSLSVDRHPTLK